ncbi:MAG: iron-sulfur cluster assembly accessory protein [Gammaproteobacteria bacterium]|nr:iron-sulfur cluster assembly accessory protein [Gammaproteobacteria bacterium]MCI0591092.1 iron-sulfur cluster assembly accessory protein [Gammaproteobacteria bacterium]
MSITLTERAARHVSRYLIEHGNGAALRLAVRTTGCSGYMYVVDAATQINAQDHVFESYGVKLIVDPESLSLLDGTELDYVQEGFNEGFKFHNPNVRAVCGCGESFSA